MALITELNINAALTKLAMLEFWPSEPAVRVEIGIFLARMCISRESLDWLTTQLVNRVGRWPGPREVRGIYCTRFPPADGENAYSEIAEFSPEASEGRVTDESAHYKLTPGRPALFLCGEVAKPQEPIPDAEMEALFQAALERQREWKNNKPTIDRKNLAMALTNLKKQGA